MVSWWDFVKSHYNEVQHIKGRKERFQMLSEMWKNEKAKMITVHSTYLLELHDKNASLRSQVETLLHENERLQEIIEYLKEHMA